MGGNTKAVALNGAQVNAMVELINSHEKGILTKSQSINLIMISFGLSEKDAKSIIEGDEVVDGNNG